MLVENNQLKMSNDQSIYVVDIYINDNWLKIIAVKIIQLIIAVFSCNESS